MEVQSRKTNENQRETVSLKFTGVFTVANKCDSNDITSDITYPLFDWWKISKRLRKSRICPSDKMVWDGMVFLKVTSNDLIRNGRSLLYPL